MADSVLSVCWKEHASELATVYKSLLESNFLVDCTISAEGQKLKAHRLVLSASSPYFHDLFSEESGKHPFVILLDASFETLKALIDFVYRGETQIPEGNLKPFLTLAQLLQIKGLNDFTQDNEHKNCSSSAAENVSEDTFGKNQVTCEVQNIYASQEVSPENNAQKLPHHFVGYTDALPTNCSVPLKEHNVLCDEVRSTSVMTPLQKQWIPDGCDVSTAMEITVKDEPVFSTFSEERNEMLDNIKSDEPMLGNFTSNVDGRTAVCGEEDLNLLSGYNENFHGNKKPPELLCSQQRLRDQMCSDSDIAQESESLLPEVLVPKSEQLTDEENIDLIDYPDESGNHRLEIVEESGLALHEQKLDQCSRAEVLPPENDLATPQRSGVRLWGPGRQEASTTPLAHLELQLREEPVLSATGREARTSSSSLADHKPTRKRKHSCGVCGAFFTNRSHLVTHRRTHTGELPYVCHVCGASFTKRSHFNDHCRIHTGERPFSCDVCGASFTQRSNLVSHRRTHTGERPFVCDVCGISFTHRCRLVIHIRKHTGERPFSCDVCGDSFAKRSNLVTHARTHTGERPFSCDVCGGSFTTRSNLVAHSRTHTVGRSYRCDVR